MLPGTTNTLQGTEKLRELILYISTVSEDDEYFSVTKLNKLLFYSDFAKYLNHGSPITGQEYIKLQYGPVPKSINLLIEDMQRKKELAIANRDVNGRQQKKPYALRYAQLASFTGDDIAQVMQVVKWFKSMTATQISENSHAFNGWKLAKLGETIPYPAVLLDSRPLTVKEKSYIESLDLTGVEELLQQHGAGDQEPATL